MGRLGYPQVAWVIDGKSTRVSWVHIHLRLASTGTFLLLGECGSSKALNPLIGNLLHFTTLKTRYEAFLAIHSIGGTVHAIASLADALAWLVQPPIGCVVGALSNVGLINQLPGRYGLKHCRIRLHRHETVVDGPTYAIVGYTAFLMNRQPPLADLHAQGCERRYLTATECVALKILNADNPLPK